MLVPFSAHAGGLSEQEYKRRQKIALAVGMDAAEALEEECAWQTLLPPDFGMSGAFTVEAFAFRLVFPWPTQVSLSLWWKADDPPARSTHAAAAPRRVKPGERTGQWALLLEQGRPARGYPDPVLVRICSSRTTAQWAFPCPHTPPCRPLDCPDQEPVFGYERRTDPDGFFVDADHLPPWYAAAQQALRTEQESQFEAMCALVTKYGEQRAPANDPADAGTAGDTRRPRRQTSLGLAPHEVSGVQATLAATGGLQRFLVPAPQPPAAPSVQGSGQALQRLLNEQCRSRDVAIAEWQAANEACFACLRRVHPERVPIMAKGIEAPEQVLQRWLHGALPSPHGLDAAGQAEFLARHEREWTQAIDLVQARERAYGQATAAQEAATALCLALHDGAHVRREQPSSAAPGAPVRAICAVCGADLPTQHVAEDAAPDGAQLPHAGAAGGAGRRAEPEAENWLLR